MSEELFYFEDLGDIAQGRAYDYLFENGYWKEELDYWRNEHVLEVLNFFKSLNIKVDKHLNILDYGIFGYLPQGSYSDLSCFDLTQKYFGWDKDAGDPYDGEFHYWLIEEYISPEASEYGDCGIYDSLLREWNEGIEPLLNQFIEISDDIRSVAERYGEVQAFYSDECICWDEQVRLIDLFEDFRTLVEKMPDKANALFGDALDGVYEATWVDFEQEVGNTFLYYEDGTIAVDEDGNYIRSEYY